MSQLSENNDYISFLKSVRSEIQSARIRAAKTVSKELISLYWRIGEIIVRKQKELGCC